MRAIQDALITAPTLLNDDDKCQPDLKTDANKHDKGVVLSRVDRQGKRRIIFIVHERLRRSRTTVVTTWNVTH